MSLAVFTSMYGRKPSVTAEKQETKIQVQEIRFLRRVNEVVINEIISKQRTLTIHSEWKE